MKLNLLSTTIRWAPEPAQEWENQKEKFSVKEWHNPVAVSVPQLLLATTLPAQRACKGINDCLWIKKHFQFIPSSYLWYKNAGTQIMCVHLLWYECLCIKCYNKTHWLLRKLCIFCWLQVGLHCCYWWSEGEITLLMLYVLREVISAEKRLCILLTEHVWEPLQQQAASRYFYFGKTKWLKATAVDVFRCRRKPLAHWTLKMRFLCARCLYKEIPNRGCQRDIIQMQNAKCTWKGRR